jgi:hypothetical protein
LLTAERCIARVATPSETVKDKVFTLVLTYSVKPTFNPFRVAIMPPTKDRRKAQGSQTGAIAYKLAKPQTSAAHVRPNPEKMKRC